MSTTKIDVNWEKYDVYVIHLPRSDKDNQPVVVESDMNTTQVSREACVPHLGIITYEGKSSGYLSTYYEVDGCIFRKTYFIRLDNGQLIEPYHRSNMGCSVNCIALEEEWKLEPGIYLEIEIERYRCKDPYHVVIEKVEFTGDKIICTLLDDFFTRDVSPPLRW